MARHNRVDLLMAVIRKKRSQDGKLICKTKALFPDEQGNPEEYGARVDVFSDYPELEEKLESLPENSVVRIKGSISTKEWNREYSCSACSWSGLGKEVKSECTKTRVKGLVSMGDWREVICSKCYHELILHDGLLSDIDYGRRLFINASYVGEIAPLEKKRWLDKIIISRGK